MFESNFRNSNASLGLASSTDQINASLATFCNSTDVYGLQASASPQKNQGSGRSLTGRSFWSGGSLLIQGGTTSTAEINEVNSLLSQAIYDRDEITGGRTYTNYSYGTRDLRSYQSANESVGMDRGDYLTNAIGVGTVVYRSDASVYGTVGYTGSGIRDQDDYFSFTVGKSGTVNLSLSGLSQNAGLALYDANHRLVGQSDNVSNSNELISRTLNTGTYFARVYSVANQPWHGATSYNLTIDRQADALENYWKNLLVDSSVENAALNSTKFDNSLSRSDVIGILKSAGSAGSVTSTELLDLRNFYNEISKTNVAAELKVLTQKVLFSETSNQWYTGSDSIRAELGNLAANSSTTQLNLLIGKHFLGTDRPAIHLDGNSLAGYYTRSNGSLFIGGATASDVVQGSTGNCYFLAALAGTANDRNWMISDMFRDNGDGTWTVRFYTNGKTDYVTVDRMMATNSSGNYIYANQSQSVASNNELWVALAEKAYAQVNESGRIGQDSTNFYGNGNDNGIGWGLTSAAITHITNLSTTSGRLTSSNFSGGDITRNGLINLVNSNRIVIIENFNRRAIGSNSGETNISSAVQRHSYPITGYNAVTGRFTIRNPWGSRHLSLTFDQLMQLDGTVVYSNS